MTPVMAHALGAKYAYLAVEHRLTAAGSITELDILRRMSADEIDVLVRRERGIDTDTTPARYPLGAHPGMAG